MTGGSHGGPAGAGGNRDDRAGRQAVLALSVPPAVWSVVAATDGYGFDLPTGWTPFTFGDLLLHGAIAAVCGVAGSVVASSFGLRWWAAVPWVVPLVAFAAAATAPLAPDPAPADLMEVAPAAPADESD